MQWADDGGDASVGISQHPPPEEIAEALPDKLRLRVEIQLDSEKQPLSSDVRDDGMTALQRHESRAEVDSVRARQFQQSSGLDVLQRMQRHVCRELTHVHPLRRTGPRRMCLVGSAEEGASGKHAADRQNSVRQSRTEDGDVRLTHRSCTVDHMSGPQRRLRLVDRDQIPSTPSHALDGLDELTREWTGGVPLDLDRLQPDQGYVAAGEFLLELRSCLGVVRINEDCACVDGLEGSPKTVEQGVTCDRGGGQRESGSAGKCDDLRPSDRSGKAEGERGIDRCDIARSLQKHFEAGCCVQEGAQVRIVVALAGVRAGHLGRDIERIDAAGAGPHVRKAVDDVSRRTIGQDHPGPSTASLVEPGVEAMHPRDPGIARVPVSAVGLVVCFWVACDPAKLPDPGWVQRQVFREMLEHHPGCEAEIGHRVSDVALVRRHQPRIGHVIAHDHGRRRHLEASQSFAEHDNVGSFGHSDGEPVGRKCPRIVAINEDARQRGCLSHGEKAPGILDRVPRVGHVGERHDFARV